MVLFFQIMVPFLTQIYKNVYNFLFHKIKKKKNVCHSKYICDSLWRIILGMERAFAKQSVFSWGCRVYITYIPIYTYIYMSARGWESRNFAGAPYFSVVPKHIMLRQNGRCTRDTRRRGGLS